MRVTYSMMYECLFIYTGTSPSYLTNLLSLRLAEAVEPRNYVRNSFS